MINFSSLWTGFQSTQRSPLSQAGNVRTRSKLDKPFVPTKMGLPGRRVGSGVR